MFTFMVYFHIRGSIISIANMIETYRYVSFMERFDIDYGECNA